MNIALTLVAAMLQGVGLVLQQRAAQEAPRSYYMRLRLLGTLFRRPRWLLGIAVMMAGNILAGWELGQLPLALTEPLLASSLIFALALAVPLSGQRLRAIELVGALVLSIGVAALSVARTAGFPDVSLGLRIWPAAAGIAAVAYIFVHAGHRRSGSLRATLTGVGTGLVFGISDALTRQTVQIMQSHSVTVLLTSWPPYALAATTLVGLWLMENAFNAAPLHTSLPAMTAAEPVAGIVLGIVVFDDEVATSAGMVTLQAAGIALLIIGVIMVSRSSVFRHLQRRADGTSGPPGPRPAAAGSAAEPVPAARRPVPAETGPAPAALATVRAELFAAPAEPAVAGARLVPAPAEPVPVEAAPLAPEPAPRPAEAVPAAAEAVPAATDAAAPGVWPLAAG